MKTGVLIAALLFCLPHLVNAQDAEATPGAWKPANRPIADWISNAAVSAQIGVDMWKAAERDGWRGIGCEGLKLGGAMAVTTGLKALIHERRPDGSDYNSIPSGHETAGTATLGKDLTVSIPLDTLIGAMKVAGNRHRWYDVLAGAGVGGLMNWGVGKLGICR